MPLDQPFAFAAAAVIGSALLAAACVGGPGSLPDESGTGSAEKPPPSDDSSGRGESSAPSGEEATDETGAKGECTPGASVVCRCADRSQGTQGTRLCAEDKTFGECACAAADGG